MSEEPIEYPEPTYEAEDCPHCKDEDERDGYEYTQEMTWDKEQGCWTCDRCRSVQ